MIFYKTNRLCRIKNMIPNSQFNTFLETTVKRLINEYRRFYFIPFKFYSHQYFLYHSPRTMITKIEFKVSKSLETRQSDEFIHVRHFKFKWLEVQFNEFETWPEQIFQIFKCQVTFWKIQFFQVSHETNNSEEPTTKWPIKWHFQLAIISKNFFLGQPLQNVEKAPSCCR